MRFSPNKFTSLAAVAIVACYAFGDPIQTGESSTDVSGNMQLKWLGRTQPGNLLNVEAMLSLGMLPDTSDGRFAEKISTARVSLDFHPPKILDVRLSMPFLVKQTSDGFTGPFGDMSLDICKKWSKNENILTALTVGFPTGYSAIQKINLQGTTPRDGVTFMDPASEPGNGLFDAQIRASYAFLPNWGFINLGGAYSAGLFAIRTTEYGYDTITQGISHKTMEFQIARDGLGATNEAGVCTPDRLNIYGDLGIKTEMLVHCFSIGCSFPMESGKVYNLSKQVTLGTYSTKDSAAASLHASPDTSYEIVANQGNDQWVYLQKVINSVKTVPYLTLQYNVEKNDMVFPVFLGAMLRLDIDKSLMFGGLSVGLGFKFPVY